MPHEPIIMHVQESVAVIIYPILFELYRRHLEGELREPGVRAMILYPVNALANDQRERLGVICKRLRNERTDFPRGDASFRRRHQS